MNRFKRVISCQVFDESADKFTGSSSILVLMIVLAGVGAIFAGLAGLAVLLKTGTELKMFGLLVVSFSLACGLCWHYGLRGRALNGLILSLVASGLILLGM